MRVLLDTNIVIHRETSNIINRDIGVLFRWIDNLHYKKCVHPLTIAELNKYKNEKVLNTMNVKLDNYNILKTEAPLTREIAELSQQVDENENDINDTRLLNELFNDRVDMLITEDRKIYLKAEKLGISDRVFTIESFLEKTITDHPDPVDYKVLSVKKEYFGNIDLNDEFFESFMRDYDGFRRWFNKKADEIAYICKAEDKVIAFLYLKAEDKNEDYSNITPAFEKKRRLKIGTFKVSINGYKLGERFLKIIFDNAIRLKVDEIYVTIFNRSIEQNRLIGLLEDFGFKFHGYKGTSSGQELVYVRDFSRNANIDNPKLTFPYFSIKGNIFIVPIYPQYHTNLFPDSILNNESSSDYTENEPFRNAISKVYISRSVEKNLNSGDIVVFYRTGGKYAGVVTTIGIVENVMADIKDEKHFVRLCKKRSVFSEAELISHWNYKKNYRPFIVNFLYTYSLPKRPNLEKLINLGVIKDINSAPRGFTPISQKNFFDIIKEAQVDEGVIID